MPETDDLNSEKKEPHPPEASKDDTKTEETLEAPFSEDDLPF